MTFTRTPDADAPVDWAVMLALASLFVTLFVTPAWPADQVVARHPEFWGALDLGAWSVGYQRETAGSTVVDIWYPATRGCPTPMSFGDYLRRSPDLRGAVEGFPDAPGSMGRSLSVAITGVESGLDADVAGRILASPMAACLDASPASGATSSLPL